MPFISRDRQENTIKPAGKWFLSSVSTSDVSFQPVVVDKTFPTVVAGVQLVLVLGVHHLQVPPKVGVASRAVRALLLASVDVSSSPVHHHLQPPLELHSTGLASDHLSVVLVSFVIVQQNLVLGSETTGIANAFRDNYFLAVLFQVILVHLLLFESLGTFGTMVGSPVDCVDVELLGVVVLVLLMDHSTLAIPLGHPVVVNVSPVLLFTCCVGYEKVFCAHRTNTVAHFKTNPGFSNKFVNFAIF